MMGDTPTATGAGALCLSQATISSRRLVIKSRSNDSPPEKIYWSYHLISPPYSLSDLPSFPRWQVFAPRAAGHNIPQRKARSQ